MDFGVCGKDSLQSSSQFGFLTSPIDWPWVWFYAIICINEELFDDCLWEILVNLYGVMRKNSYNLLCMFWLFFFNSFNGGANMRRQRLWCYNFQLLGFFVASTRTSLKLSVRKSSIFYIIESNMEETLKHHIENVLDIYETHQCFLIERKFLQDSS